LECKVFLALQKLWELKMKGCVTFTGLTLISLVLIAQAEAMLEKNQKKQNDKKAPGLHNMIDKQ
jgi:hypothetical protein